MVGIATMRLCILQYSLHNALKQFAGAHMNAHAFNYKMQPLLANSNHSHSASKQKTSIIIQFNYITT